MTFKKVESLGLSASTSAQTGKAIYVGDSEVIGVLFRRSEHTAGNSAFTVKASMDDVSATSPTLTALNMMIDNVTNTNAQNLTRTNGKTLSAAGDAFMWLDPSVKLGWLQINCTNTTDGKSQAWVILKD